MKFECQYCGKDFVRESSILKHRCMEMERAEEIKTIIGQTAYIYYQKWMQLYRRNVPSIEVFMTSKFYTSFIKFATYCRQINMPDVEAFIKLMIDKDLSPQLWTYDKAYVMYIEHLDWKTTPIQQASICINTLLDQAKRHDIDVSNVFDTYEPGDIMQLLRERKLSPWILLNSSKFRDFLINKCTREQRILFEELIRPMHWKYRFDKNPDAIKHMKTFIAEMKI